MHRRAHFVNEACVPSLHFAIQLFDLGVNVVLDSRMCVKTEAVYDLRGKLLSRRVGELQAHRQRQSSLAVVAVSVPPFRVTGNDRRKAHGESVTLHRLLDLQRFLGFKRQNLKSDRR